MIIKLLVLALLMYYISLTCFEIMYFKEEELSKQIFQLNLLI